MPLKSFFRLFLSISRTLLKLLRTNPLFFHQRPATTPKLQKQPSPPRHPDILPPQTLAIFGVEGWLLRSSSTFPYFMLVAFEGSGPHRALLLLLLYPLLCCMSNEAALRVMVMVCFVGVRKEGFRVGRAVLPKFFLEDVGDEGLEVVRKAGRRAAAASAMPMVMVESFLKDYLGFEVVVGRELKELGGFYTGFMMEELELKEVMNTDEGQVVGFGCHGKDLHRKVFSMCKEVYRVSESEKNSWRPLPREKYPKPLIFHDSRIVFRPMPVDTLAMFMWLPFGISLSILRSLVFILLPYSISISIGALSGMVGRFSKPEQALLQPSSEKPNSGRLYICNHRTLLDPIYISAAIKKEVAAVVYSLSSVSEFLSPIKTARLTRNKEEDRKRMGKLLKQGNLVVCPEGTTCREPYLLRFSPLFAELADEITPVALRAEVSMFYGTTTVGFKWLDSFYFLMNPQPGYVVELLDDMSTASQSGSFFEAASRVQGEIGRALGFECTGYTRKDKYRMLAGNDGVVMRMHVT